MLRSAKYALLNEDYKQISGIANLNQKEKKLGYSKAKFKVGGYNVSETNRE